MSFLISLLIIVALIKLWFFRWCLF